jgi:hypothetical protein
MLPPMIEFMGHEIEVAYTLDLPEGEYGHCKPMQEEIRVAEYLSETSEIAVILHELAHFLWFKTREQGETIGEEEFCKMVELFATIPQITKNWHGDCI